MSKKTVQKSKKRTTRANKKRTTGVKANTVVKSAPVTSEKVTEVKPVEVPKKVDTVESTPKTTVQPKETSEKVVAAESAPDVKTAPAKKATTKKATAAKSTTATSKKTTTVGVVIPNIVNSYFATLAKGIDDIATMYKYNIVLASSDDNEDHEVTVIHSLISKQVDGIIFMGHHLTEKIRAEFSRTRTPIVLAGTVDLEHQLPSVNIDYKAAVEDSVTQLAKNNEKVAFVSGPLIDDINGKLRLAGYKSGLEKNNLSYNEGLVFEAKYSYKDGFELAQRVLNSGATAAYVGEDELAAGLLNGLFAAGKSVPEDFEIITSNDSPITSYTRPNLSSINHPLYDLGAVSMRMLTKIMNKEELEEKDVILNHGITLRQSTK